MAITEVQAVTAYSTSVTISATGSGNTVVVCICTGAEFGAPTVTSVKLGTASLTQAVSKVYDYDSDFWASVWIYYLSGVASGQTSITITGNSNLDVAADSGGVTVYEFAGVAASASLDKTNSAEGSSTTWTSGASGTLSQASEVAVGVVCIGSDSGLTGPSGWTNAIYTGDAGASGYLVVSSTASVTYSGSQSSSGDVYSACIATFEAAATAATAPYVRQPPRRGQPAATRGKSTSVTGKYTAPTPAPFTAPMRPARGAQAAAKGSARGETGVYTAPPPVVVSPFTHPIRAARGALAALRGRGQGVAGKYTAPPPPSPFTPPVKPAKGSPAARRGTAASSAGAPYTTKPAPFTPPHAPARGRAAAGRGTGHAGTTVPRPRLVSLFKAPAGPARGRMAARRGTGNPGTVTPTWTPVAPRNLLLSLASQSGTDDYGNAFPQGIYASAGLIEGPTVIAGESTETQVELTQSNTGVGLLRFLLNNTNFANPAMFSSVVGTYAALDIVGPVTNAYGDQVYIGLYSSSSGSTFANLTLIYVDPTGTPHEYAYLDGSGFNINAASNLNMAEPGTGTGPYNTAVGESLHSITTINGFGGAPQYKLLPGGMVCITGSVTLPSGSATYNYVQWGYIPTGYQPGATRNYPCTLLAGTTYGNPNYAGSPHVIVDSGGALYLYAIPGNLNGDTVDVSGVYSLLAVT
jgi:hypothetical protein